MMTANEEFIRFAEDKLNTHIEELSIRYRNEPLGSSELINEAYDVHRNIFSKELDEKIQSLVKTDNPWLKGELENLKNDFEARLTQKNT